MIFYVSHFDKVPADVKKRDVIRLIRQQLKHRHVVASYGE